MLMGYCTYHNWVQQADHLSGAQRPSTEGGAQGPFP